MNNDFNKFGIVLSIIMIICLSVSIGKMILIVMAAFSLGWLVAIWLYSFLLGYWIWQLIKNVRELK